MATFYIDPNGDDGDNGGIGDPWASLSHACSEVSGWGDIIHVNAGTYYESNECVLAEGVSIVGVGNGSHIISTYETDYTGDHASITLYSSSQGTDGSQSISYIKLDGDSCAGSYAIKVIQRSNVIIHHCTIVDFYIGGVAFWGQGYHTNTPSEYATGNKIHHSIVQNCGGPSGTSYGAGTVHIGTQTDMEINDNTLEALDNSGHNGNLISAVWYYKKVKIYNNICRKLEYDALVDPQWSFMFELPAGNSCYGGVEIYGNEFYGGDQILDLGGDYTEIGTDAYTFYVHDNLFWQEAPTQACDNDNKMAIDLEGLMNTDVWIKRNRFHNFHHPITIDQGGPYSNVSNVWIENNIMEECGYVDSPDDAYKYIDILTVNHPNGNSTLENLFIFNNIISPNGYNVSSTISLSTSGSISNVNIKNNIITGHHNGTWLKVINNGDFDGLYISNNCLHDNASNTPDFSGNTVTNYSGVAGSVESDPLLLGDFHLQESTPPSPCIDAGVDVGIDYSGSAPDIGAYETGLTANKPTVTTTTITNITTDSATSGGNVTDEGDSSVTAKGVCWSESTNPTLSDDHTDDGTGSGSYISDITGLTHGTTYHVRAYATNTQGTSYGTDRSFVTNSSGNIPVTAVTVTGEGGVNYINVDDGKLQCSSHIDPHDATDKTVVWSIINQTGSATVNQSGVVTATGNGTVRVRATANG